MRPVDVSISMSLQAPFIFGNRPEGIRYRSVPRFVFLPHNPKARPSTSGNKQQVSPSTDMFIIEPEIQFNFCIVRSCIEIETLSRALFLRSGATEITIRAVVFVRVRRAATSVNVNLLFNLLFIVFSFWWGGGVC